MPRLILLLAIIAVIYILFKRSQAVPPHKRKAEYIKLGLGLAVGIVLILTITGKMHWIGIAATGLLVALRQMLPTLVRLFPMLTSMRARGAQDPGAAGGGQTSTVETSLLRMHLDHDSGNLQGEVLQGKYEGWLLAEMDREQLKELLEYCVQQDQDSAELLESYLQQRFAGEAPFGEEPPPEPTSQGMNRKEALDLLGLEEEASEEEIVSAHRKLMQKVHPDRGGSDYLAAKINQAKDFLLG